MSGILDPQDHHIPLRKLNLANDPAPGEIVSSAGISGSIIQPYLGQLGKRLVCTPALALKLSDTSIGTLYEGIYQYVKFDTASVRGGLMYWNSAITPNLSNGPYENFNITATPSPGSNVLRPFAGVALCVITSGNYGYIQITGKASVLFRNPITNANGAQGVLVLMNGVLDNTADILNAASPINMNLANLALGITLQTPSNNTISLVDLWNTRQVMGGFGGF